MHVSGYNSADTSYPYRTQEHKVSPKFINQLPGKNRLLAEPPVPLPLNPKQPTHSELGAMLCSVGTLGFRV